MPKVSIEAGCQVSLVGRHIEEPVVFCVCSCPNFPNKKRSASLRMHVNRFPKTRQPILLRLLWISFVWDAKVIEHFLLLVCTSIDCYRRILPNTSLSEYRIKDGELEMDISRQKSSIYFVFLTQVFVI